MVMPTMKSDDQREAGHDFAERKQASDVGQHKPMNWDAEMAKIARLRQMRLARDAQVVPKKRRDVVTIPIKVADA